MFNTLCSVFSAWGWWERFVSVKGGLAVYQLVGGAVSYTHLDVYKRQAKFSTGDAVSSKDVVSSYKRIVDGDKDSTGAVQPSSYAAFLTAISGIEAKDDSTVTIKLTHAIDNLKERLALIKVVPSKATFDELTKMPVGSEMCIRDRFI